MSHETLAPGGAGWASQHRPPIFEAERPGPFDWTARHLPAAIRVFGATSPVGLPRMNENEAYTAVQSLTDEHVRRVLHKIKVPPDGRDSTWALVRWVRVVERCRSWWSSQWAWRAPREFRGWRQFEQKNGLPHLEPYELAQFRLPEDVVMDADVVLLQAWAQGVNYRHIDHPQLLPITECIHRGLAKLHASPWFCLALAAPHMQPAGVVFGNHGALRSAERMVAILAHPYTATDGELEAIFDSPMYKVGYEAARRKRLRGTYTNPDGGWYAMQHRHALGQFFRRGNEWHHKRPSKMAKRSVA